MLPTLSFLTAILLLSSMLTITPIANAITRSTFNDEHLTARFGNTKVCGDHLCGPGEYQKMAGKIKSAQIEHNTFS